MAKLKGGYINARDLQLKQWIKLIFSTKRKKTFPFNCFPTDEMREEYLNSIRGISENEVKDLLRVLLPNTSRIGADNEALKNLISMGGESLVNALDSSEYWRRNLSNRNDVWEGLTWVLDLLPDHPKAAIKTINAYFTAHCQFMTDNQMDGLSDCVSIIRSKYFDVEHPRSILLSIDWEEFEWLIEELYKKLGYSTELTPKHDHGIDIIATKKSVGKKEKLLIQCKRYSKNIGEPVVINLNGAIHPMKGTRGILISTSEFTKSASIFAEVNPSIELIGYKKLNTLFNIHLSPKWPLKIDTILMNRRRTINGTK